MRLPVFDDIMIAKKERERKKSYCRQTTDES